MAEGAVRDEERELYCGTIAGEFRDLHCLHVGRQSATRS